MSNTNCTRYTAHSSFPEAFFFAFLTVEKSAIIIAKDNMAGRKKGWSHMWLLATATSYTTFTVAYTSSNILRKQVNISPKNIFHVCIVIPPTTCFDTSYIHIFGRLLGYSFHLFTTSAAKAAIANSSWRKDWNVPPISLQVFGSTPTISPLLLVMLLSPETYNFQTT